MHKELHEIKQKVLFEYSINYIGNTNGYSLSKKFLRIMGIFGWLYA